MKKCVLSLVMFALSVAPWPASAGVIRGTLHVPAASTLSGTATNAYPGHADAIPGAKRTTRGQVTDAVIYVDRIPAEVESTLAAAKWNAPRLAQKDQMFVPRVVAIAAGSSVDFPNMDPIYHNVFSPSPTRRFDLGKYPKGSSRRVEFRKPGIVNVYCEIHSNMEAFVVVVPNHAFTRPSATGEFALPDLPAGSYDLHVWHPDLGTQTVTVQVPAEGDVAQSLNY
jgi:plastocyanin